MNTVFAWLLVAVVATPGPAPGPSDRPLREIGRLRASPFCSSFTTHFNNAVAPVLQNDQAVALMDKSLDDVERHFMELGGEVRVYDDRLRLADSVRRMEANIPRAQNEINALRDGARLTSDAERIKNLREVASQMQRALDKHKQIAHDVGNVVHVLMEMAAADPGAKTDERTGMLQSISKAIGGPEFATVGAPALGSPAEGSAPLKTTVKEILRWSGQRDRIDEAEGKAALLADQIITTSC